MYTITKRLEISGAHRLELNYDSKCANLHGHNWIIDITCEAEALDENGMVCDFTHISQQVKGALDHKCLNEVIPVNPTAENIAAWIAAQIGTKCKRVSVQESEGNVATYEV